MKFVYEYRTPDNVRHDGVISAASRDAAFVALKEQGIRPSRLVAAPGVANLILGTGKRWMAIVVLAALLVAAVCVVMNLSRQVESASDLFDNTTRRQVLGDAAVIEKGVRTGWADVFAADGDRFLASFAIPGTRPSVGSTSVGALADALSHAVVPTETDGLEARQIKAMVEGMKNEARAFVAAGGSLERYGQRLVERQETELAIWNRARTELETLAKQGLRQDLLEERWEQRNDELRALGLRLVALPE